ncbi:ester cyclase [Actinoplanes sp. KI2]|uniref:ester cyclase n=1 Tax=Actinoplanes sp. KI2 TaxID=2983315 RepID=UPI0021D5E1D8|nr:ester cyclase [Actinoplanes sp. KI2]MCU7729577.1 ester cyclase [Actinoplanes sp. KI2]
MPLLDFARRFFDAMNKQDLDTVASMISPKADVRTPIGSFIGNTAYKDWMAMHFRAFPDFTHEVRGLSLVSEQDQTLAFELHATGTHAGPLPLATGELSPTGRRLDVPAADFWRLENGLIVEYRLYFNLLDFLEQLGVAPTPAVSAA